MPSKSGEIMELKILDKKQEPLLSRVKITASVSFDTATPSYKDMMPQIASAAKTQENLVAIRTVKNSFGARKAEITAYAYNDENSKMLIEPKVKEKKAKEKKAPEKKE